MPALHKTKGIEYFAMQKKSGPKTVEAFSEMWAVDQKRNSAWCSFAGDWVQQTKDDGFLTTVAEDVIGQYARGQYVKSPNELGIPSQHVVQQLYAFANSADIDDGKPIDEMVVVAHVQHHLSEGPWNKRPLTWYSIDEAKVAKTPDPKSFRVMDVKVATFGKEVAADKYFDERAEGYGSIDPQGQSVTPMYWDDQEVFTRICTEGRWNLSFVYLWIEDKRLDLIEKREEQLRKLMKVDPGRLGATDFAKRFQAQMGKLT